MKEKKSGLEERYAHYADIVPETIMKASVSKNVYNVCRHEIGNYVSENGLKKVTIVDIGVGEGGQYSEILADIPESVEVEIVGIDIAESILESARINLEKIGAKFVPILDKIENVSREVLPEKVDVVIALYSLHHVVEEEIKKRVIGFIHKLKPGLFIIADDDVHTAMDLETENPELEKNVNRTFLTLIETVKDQVDGNIKPAIDFLEGERQRLLSVPKEAREEYYIYLREWVAMLKESGFEILRPSEKSTMEIPITMSEDESYFYIDESKVFGMILARGVT